MIYFTRGIYELLWGFPSSSDSKEFACSAGDLPSVPGLGRYPEERNDCPLQHSCLENPRTEEPGGLQSLGLQESDMIERLHHHNHHFAL